jgi:hypothetical protein
LRLTSIGGSSARMTRSQTGESWSLQSMKIDFMSVSFRAVFFDATWERMKLASVDGSRGADYMHRSPMQHNVAK